MTKLEERLTKINTWLLDAGVVQLKIKGAVPKHLEINDEHTVGATEYMVVATYINDDEETLVSGLSYHTLRQWLDGFTWGLGAMGWDMKPTGDCTDPLCECRVDHSGHYYSING